MLRPSFVPPPPIRRLRDLTRYRVDLVVERTAEKQRVERLLEDAQMMRSVAASDIFGVSGRQMMAALVAGERDPRVLAQMARTALRGKITQLGEPLTRRFDEYHAFLLAKMLARVDRLNDDITDVEARVEEQIAPFAGPVVRLADIPTAAHLASWARFVPVVNEPAGKKKASATGRGNRCLARALGESVTAASRTDTVLGQRYRRLVRRRGKPKAIVAVGRSMLIIVWNLLANPAAHFTDLGPDYYDNRISNSRKMHSYVAGLETLVYKVIREPAA